ncbi:alpha/beta hydrolase [Candidatus Kaiserbacteria bacterium]|nr:alpha/beta hydrolase [Candidatus Kaiserbacteria bacterium]
MNKLQVIYIHGGEGWSTYEEYLTYLKTTDVIVDPRGEAPKRWSKTLSERLGDDFQVLSIQMPSKQNAKYNEWKIWFERHFQFFDNEVVLIGHSLGANFLAKYLSENTFPRRILSLHLVAGCFGEPGWFELPKDLSNIEKQTKDIVIYHSHDDDVVPFSAAGKYKVSLPSAKVVEFSDRGHFLGEEFPELVQNVTNYEKDNI